MRVLEDVGHQNVPRGCGDIGEQGEDEEELSFSGGGHREGRCSWRGVAEGSSRFKIRKKKIK